MRRNEREITDPKIIEEIIHQATICRIALYDADYPYIVPLNYGYESGALYFHSAKEGKKIDLIRKNSRVCFEIEGDNTIVKHEIPCKWSAKYSSIIGFGHIEFISDIEGKKRGLDLIMAHYGRPEGNRYDDMMVERVLILKLVIEKITAKQSKL